MIDDRIEILRQKIIARVRNADPQALLEFYNRGAFITSMNDEYVDICPAEGANVVYRYKFESSHRAGQ